MPRAQIYSLMRRQISQSVNQSRLYSSAIARTASIPRTNINKNSQIWQSRLPAFSTSARNNAQPPTADALMETLTDLYATAKDEFEIAAEETEKKTVYAADDRDAAREAFGILKEAYEKAVRESDPETAKEVQSRTGPRIKELENALTAVEEMAMED